MTALPYFFLDFVRPIFIFSKDNGKSGYMVKRVFKTLRGFFQRLPLERMPNYRGVLALLVVFLLCVIFSPRHIRTGQRLFLTFDVQKDILFERSEYGILAAGMTLVILTGGIDLSVGSVLGMTAVLFSIFLIPLGWSPVVAIFLCLLAAWTAGLLNGLMVASLRIQPFAATLAMMVAARGVAKLVSGGQKISAGMVGFERAADPPIFSQITSPVFRGFLPPMTLIFLLCIFVLWFILRSTPFGRYLYAIGGNEEAARLSGIRVSFHKIMAYGICGLTAGIAGICNASRLTQGDPEAGFTYELDAIAAVVIGGTSLMGGRGGMLLTLIGTLIVGYIDKLLSLHGFGTPMRLMAKGAIIVLAVMIQQKS